MIDDIEIITSGMMSFLLISNILLIQFLTISYNIYVVMTGKRKVVSECDIVSDVSSSIDRVGANGDVWIWLCASPIDSPMLKKLGAIYDGDKKCWKIRYNNPNLGLCER